MREIINPWTGRGIYNCFGCSKENKIGLHLHFFDNGEEVFCTWEPAVEFAGYIDTLHGGIQSTMHDEIASWVVYTKAETAGMTTELNVKYLKSVLISDGEIKLTAKIIKQDRRFATIETNLYNGKGELASTGLVTYRLFPQQMAIEKMHYPGVDAFYKQE